MNRPPNQPQWNYHSGAYDNLHDDPRGATFAGGFAGAGAFVSSPYGTPDRPTTPKRRRLPGRGPVMVVLPLLMFGFMFFGLSYLASPEPDIEIQSGIGFGTYQGKEIALVPYERSGTRGMFQMMSQDMFATRLAAVDLESHEPLWDVALSDELLWRADVLAVAKTYAYLATADGLVIVALDDGEIVAEPSGISGIGESYVAAISAYGFDAADKAVVALDRDGAVYTIALDAVDARPAGDKTANRWAKKLSPDGFQATEVTGETADRACVDEELVVLQATATGSSGQQLETVTRSGDHHQVSDEVFYGAEILLDRSDPEGTTCGEWKQTVDLGGGITIEAGMEAKTASGAASGHILVAHKEDPNDTATRLSAVSIESGEVTAQVSIGSSLGRALSTPSGGTAVIVTDPDESTTNLLAAVTPDGDIATIAIGETNFFGATS